MLPHLPNCPPAICRTCSARCSAPPFSEYLISLRLHKAACLLLQSESSITDIGLDVGFSSTNMFIEHFRRHFGVTPGRYRRLHADEAVPLSTETSAPDFSRLMQYISPSFLKKQEECEKQQITLDLSACHTEPIRPTWRNLLNIGYARCGLLAPIQEQIRTAQREIGFRYVRFHGIFDSDMHIYEENANEQPVYNFLYADMLFDFLLSVGLHPFLELSFMPPALARNKEYMWKNDSFSSIYNNREKWIALVQTTLRHLVERYGMEEVRQWKFTSIQLNPEKPLRFSILSESNYYDFYTTTRSTVKSVDPQLTFGGPGCFASSLWDGDLIRNFVEFCKEHDCLPDFFTFQCYPYQTMEYSDAFIAATRHQRAEPLIISNDSNYVQHFLQGIRELLSQYHVDEPQIWLEEWNSTVWQRDISSDTVYKSAWLVKNICETMPLAEGFWLLDTLRFNRGTSAAAACPVPRRLWPDDHERSAQNRLDSADTSAASRRTENRQRRRLVCCPQRQFDSAAVLSLLPLRQPASSPQPDAEFLRRVHIRCSCAVRPRKSSR